VLQEKLEYLSSKRAGDSPSDKPRVILLSKHDSSLAKFIRPQLEAQGISTFWTVADVMPGEVSMKRVVKELHQSNGAVMIFEKELYKSNMIREEIEPLYNNSSWIHQELELLLRRKSLDPDFLVLPVLGPGMHVKDLPEKISEFQCVSIDETHQEELRPLVFAILESFNKTSTLHLKSLNELSAEAKILLIELGACNQSRFMGLALAVFFVIFLIAMGVLCLYVNFTNPSIDTQGVLVALSFFSLFLGFFISYEVWKHSIRWKKLVSFEKYLHTLVNNSELILTKQ